MTADGKIATANRQVSSFGSRYDRDHLFELRASADAVMAGARTVDLEAVEMGPGPAKYRRLRLRRGLREYNLRVVVSRLGTVDPGATIFQRKFSPVLVLTTRQAPEQRLKRLEAVANAVRICGSKEINFQQALRWLRERWNVRRLVCEGGGELNDGLFRTGLVDELHLTMCPKIVGGRQAPTIVDGLGFPTLEQAERLRLQSARRRGNELFLVYRTKRRVLEKKQTSILSQAGFSAKRARSQSRSDKRLR